MKIRPLNDRVVVRRNAEEEKTAGGILLPGSAKEKPNKGEIVPLSVKVGDKVIFGGYANNTIKDGDDELIIMSESEIFGVLED